MSDVRSGLNSGLYAWRRDNVAALNTAARAAWAADGRLNGPEPEAPGGRRYAAGDRIGGQLVAGMDDGRGQLFGAEDMAGDRLDYGYATTVHRAQGATVEVAHRFHDGGGRELAYVAMSRARQQATVDVVADDVDQAVEDLHRDWAHEQRLRWAIDTGTPETHALLAERSPDVAVEDCHNLRRARQEAEHHARGALPTPQPAPSLALLRQRLDDATDSGRASKRP